MSYIGEYKQLLYTMIGIICTTALAVAFGIGVVIGWVIWG